MNRSFLVFILISFHQLTSMAQVSVIDSLQIVLNTSTVPDTTKVKALNLVSWEYAITGDYNSGIKYSNEALDMINNAEKSLFFEHEKARAFINLGIIHYYKSDYIKSLEFYLRSLPILEELKDNKSMGSVYNNIGLVLTEILAGSIILREIILRHLNTT
ncbi:MAG: hypothetical protein K0S44_721 [Bacteroidetes bacterium]|nr:hypothetical protein [Bacteroidota bacterium]